MAAGAVGFVVFAAIVAFVPAVVMVLVGVRLTRAASTSGRIPVEARVVDYTYLTTPRRVTFDYPGPDGRWLRATRVEGVSPIRSQGLFPRPGDPLTVWVQPQRPDDVVLPQGGSARGFGGVALVVVGAGWGLFGLAAVLGAVRVLSNG